MKKTVAEWLKELKILDSRITNGTSRIVPIAIKNGTKLPTGFTTREELDKTITGSLESVEQLIKNRALIKSAIVKSNAVAEVTVAEVKMTVAEAIERKSSVKYQKDLLSHLERCYANAKNSVDKGNADVKARLDTMLVASRGKEGRADADADKAFSDNFLANNQLELIDPLKLRDRIEKLREEIENFEGNVDVQLSISNAITEADVV